MKLKSGLSDIQWFDATLYYRSPRRMERYYWLDRAVAVGQSDDSLEAMTDLAIDIGRALFVRAEGVEVDNADLMSYDDPIAMLVQSGGEDALATIGYAALNELKNIIESVSQGGDLDADPTKSATSSQQSPEGK